jgi:hypothetical protein
MWLLTRDPHVIDVGVTDEDFGRRHKGGINTNRMLGRSLSGQAFLLRSPDIDPAALIGPGAGAPDLEQEGLKLPARPARKRALGSAETTMPR